MNPRLWKKNLMLPMMFGSILLTQPGCKNKCPVHTPIAPLGSISDPIWQKQEENAEASEFVIHQHEFVGNTIRLNLAGEDHLKQIAVRARKTSYPVIIERSMMSPKADSKYGYPVNNDATLDDQRRQLVVKALLAMGVEDAESRVVVAPVYAPGFESFEANRAYQRGFSGRGFGGAGGGFGGGGGGGGFGGGGF